MVVLQQNEYKQLKRQALHKQVETFSNETRNTSAEMASKNTKKSPTKNLQNSALRRLRQVATKRY